MWNFGYDIGLFSRVRNTNDKKGFINSDSFNYLCSKTESGSNKDIDHMLVIALHKYKAIIVSYNHSDDKQSVRRLILSYGEEFVSLSEQLEKKYHDNQAFIKYYKEFGAILKKLKDPSITNDDFTRIALNLKGKIKNILESISNHEQFSDAFLNDYNKISTSSAFRRLQDKAQVFPLEIHDYARTRLTHTIEVSSIASEIANVIGKRIDWNKYAEKGLNKNRACYSLEKIVECASLMHDMGNPPYGHYGEDIIRQFYKDEWNSLKVVKYLFDSDGKLKKEIDSKVVGDIINSDKDVQMYNDFSCFDGNAQALRVMTKIQRFKDAQPIELSLSSLGAIIKYPFNSKCVGENKKFGYFYSENDIIDKLSVFGVFIEKYRNPLSLILEAADDISYVTSDLEDAVKKGVITKELFDLEIEKLKGCKDEYLNDFANDYRHFYEESKERASIKEPFLYSITRLIDGLKKKLILQVSDAFCKNYDLIMQGIYFEGGNQTPGQYIELLDYPEILSKEIAKWIKKNLFPNYLYKDTEILQSELKGDAVMTTLLKEFSQAVLALNFDCYGGKRDYTEDRKEFFHEQKVFSLISPNFVAGFFDEYDNAKDEKEKIYFKLKLVVDYITGMTDSYALECYRILKGIQ